MVERKRYNDSMERVGEPKMNKSGGTFTGPVRFQSALYGANLTQVTGNNGNEFHFKWEDGAISIYIDGVKMARSPLWNFTRKT